MEEIRLDVHIDRNGNKVYTYKGMTQEQLWKRIEDRITPRPPPLHWEAAQVRDLTWAVLGVIGGFEILNFFR